jgi:hypothetical protein
MTDTDDFAAHKADLIDRVRNAQVPGNMPNCRGFVDSLGVYAQNLSPEADSPSQQIDHLLERVTAAMLESSTAWRSSRSASISSVARSSSE